MLRPINPQNIFIRRTASLVIPNGMGRRYEFVCGPVDEQTWNPAFPKGVFRIRFLHSEMRFPLASPVKALHERKCRQVKPFF